MKLFFFKDSFVNPMHIISMQFYEAGFIDDTPIWSVRLNLVGGKNLGVDFIDVETASEAHELYMKMILELGECLK